MSKYIPTPAYYDQMPVDISFVFQNERPAGKHGFLKVDGDNFRFEDGTPGNLEHPLWGIRYCYFTMLEMTQEPKENFISYRFEFTQAKINGEIPK